MEAMQALYAIPGIGPVLPYLSLAAVIMMLIAPALPPPAAGSSMLYKFFYKLVNAHNWGYAVNAYMVQPMETPAPPELQARPPEVQKMVGKTPIASLLGMALLMGVLSACASQGSGIAETKVALTLADRLAIPFTVGGGISGLEDARSLLRAAARMGGYAAMPRRWPRSRPPRRWPTPRSSRPRLARSTRRRLPLRSPRSRC